MAKALAHIDGIIIRWGQRHDSQIKPSKGRLPPKSTSSKFQKPKTPKNVRQTLQSLAKKKPQVMVKVTGGGRSMSTIRAHFKYITKHGDVELENQAGEALSTKEDIEDELKQWETGGYGIRKTETSGFITEKTPSGGTRTYHPDKPNEKQQSREAVNLILSMPKGTDPEKVKEAARQFAKENFSARHEYVFGLHTDRDHPHVHISIKSRSFVDQKRLNTRKDQIQSWRESFAEHLYQQGIEAGATPRATRNALSYQRNFREKTKDGDLKISRDYGIRTPSPTMRKIAKQEQQALSNVIDALERSPDQSDKQIAKLFLSEKDLPFFDKEKHHHAQHQRRLARASTLQSGLERTTGRQATQTISSLRDVPRLDVDKRGK
jgi:hypothetical protein